MKYYKLALIVILFSSCGAARDLNGRPWTDRNPLQKILASRSVSSHQLECPPKP
jgi:hypothetical protein